MQLITDKNHFLTIQDSSLDTWKIYQHNFSWLNFNEPNCIFLTLHKKEIKLIESKNLGSTMEVFTLHDKPPFETLNFSPEYFRLACEHFIWFNEETGKRYAFLPYFATKQIDSLNDKLTKLWIQISFSLSDKWVLTSDLSLADLPANASISEDLSHLYALVILYGKRESKWENLNWFKTQIPLFGGFLGLKEIFENLISRLQKHWFVLNWSFNQQWQNATFQISSSDREILQIFANWHSSIEKRSQITKKIQTSEYIQLLVKFLENWNFENKKEIFEKMKVWTVKILEKK